MDGIGESIQQGWEYACWVNVRYDTFLTISIFFNHILVFLPYLCCFLFFLITLTKVCGGIMMTVLLWSQRPASIFLYSYYDKLLLVLLVASVYFDSFTISYLVSSFLLIVTLISDADIWLWGRAARGLKISGCCKNWRHFLAALVGFYSCYFRHWLFQSGLFYCWLSCWQKYHF